MSEQQLDIDDLRERAWTFLNFNLAVNHEKKITMNELLAEYEELRKKILVGNFPKIKSGTFEVAWREIDEQYPRRWECVCTIVSEDDEIYQHRVTKVEWDNRDLGKMLITQTKIKSFFWAVAALLVDEGVFNLI